MSVYFQNKEHVVVGAISDTHGILMSAAIKALHGVDLIIHAGDIGNTGVMDELKSIAPVVAVRGNMDMSEDLRELPETADRIRQVIAEEIPGKVAADKAYQNAMKNSDKAAARLEHDRALQKVVISMLADHTELFKQYSDNPSFKKWLSDTIFGFTYEEAGV